MSTLIATEEPRVSLPPGVKVTQFRLIASEWVKLRSLRSTYLAFTATVVAMVGLGTLFSALTASRWATLDPERKAGFDPTDVSLRGAFLAQLIIGVLGVLVVSGEYGTGMIRSSFSAAPKRLPVLWAKLVVFGAASLVVCTVSAFVAFFAGQWMLSSEHIDTTLSAPGVFRAVLGTGLYLTVVGLIGVALGWIIRHTAGAIGTLFGILLILPVLLSALPDSWGRHINPYVPSNAGQEVMTVHPEPGMLAPWTGFAVFCAYLIAAIVVAAVLLRHRDA
ncbi:MAG TPA: ABC transporter permease [Amycolatopsis sp.]|uniref:ABC transporter permease n=1 Tax=Amycolatopsis sp. TaxID=37632 RepID=UPI002B469EC7|nr:ABC transporter permease [Amycolatopsis sp.]HKS43751.1 ABC transporter permease [Amycolatopsis sp.]